MKFLQSKISNWRNYDFKKGAGHHAVTDTYD